MIGGKRVGATFAALLGFGVAQASAESWFSGDWYLKVGGAVLHAPKFEGASGGDFAFQPMISLGKAGPSARFSSRNDNISLAFIDTGTFRASPRSIRPTSCGCAPRSGAASARMTAW